MESRHVKHGQIVNTHKGPFEVLDRSPKPAHWWLHRWMGGQWQTLELHARNLELLRKPPHKEHAT